MSKQLMPNLLRAQNADESEEDQLKSDILLKINFDQLMETNCESNDDAATQMYAQLNLYK